MDETNIATLTIEIGASSDEAMKKIGEVTNALRNMKGHSSQKISVNSKDVATAHKRVGGLFNILNSLKRVAFYRLIRAAIKAVTEAFSEGAENAYWYSKTVGDTTKYISEAYDKISSGSFKMSNQLGAAWATLKATLEPVLTAIINIVTQAANALTQLFAILGGKGTYLKAVDYSKEWADTTAKGSKAAKEWKNQLMGFDEINRLEEPSKGGGGGGGGLPDYGNMFEEANVDSWIKTLTDKIAKGDWYGVGETLSGKLKKTFDTVAEKIKNFDFGAFARNTFDNIISYMHGYDVGGVVGSLTNVLSEIFISIADFINGADFGGLAVEIGDFFARAIRGIDMPKLLSSIAYLAVTLVAQIPSVLLGALAGITNIIGAIFESLGLDSVAGFFYGISEKIKTAREWLKENVIDPFINDFKNLLGIHSPSTVFEEIGDNVIQGLWNGLKEKWESLKSWWEGLSLGAFDFKTPHLRVEWEAIDANSVLARFLGFSSIPHIGIDWYAQGGFPEDGLFMANHGELVGQFSNGRTAVANNEQITEGIAKAVYEAFMEAFTQTGGNNGNAQSVNIYLDGKQIAQTTTKYQRQLARANG